MQPGNLYFLLLAIIVIPLLPFSRSALVVGMAWLPGQFVYLIKAPTEAVDFCISIMAFGAAMGLALNDRDRCIGFLFLASGAIEASLLLNNTDAYSGWWLEWFFAMARVMMLPLTINFQALKEVCQAFKERRQVNEQIWRLVLCW